jgi:hypothetical protein
MFLQNAVLEHFKRYSFIIYTKTDFTDFTTDLCGERITQDIARAFCRPAKKRIQAFCCSDYIKPPIFDKLFFSFFSHDDRIILA